MMTIPPAVTESDFHADEEEFHSAYRIFLNAVKMLSSSAEKQCELMGDYNVAWELKYDVTAGKYLIGRGFLTNSQEAWVGALVGALVIVNSQVLPSGKGREVNNLAMSEPCWEPLRFIAKELLGHLAPFTEENAKFLRLPSHAA